MTEHQVGPKRRDCYMRDIFPRFVQNTLETYGPIFHPSAASPDPRRERPRPAYSTPASVALGRGADHLGDLYGTRRQIRSRIRRLDRAAQRDVKRLGLFDNGDRRRRDGIGHRLGRRVLGHALGDGARNHDVGVDGRHHGARRDVRRVRGAALAGSWRRAERCGRPG